MALDAYGHALAAAGAASIGLLEAFEKVQRRVHPPLLPALRETLAPLRDRQAEALARFRAATRAGGVGRVS